MEAGSLKRKLGVVLSSAVLQLCSLQLHLNCACVICSEKAGKVYTARRGHSQLLSPIPCPESRRGSVSPGNMESTNPVTYPV